MEYPCAHCGQELDGGDIFEALSNYYSDKPEEDLLETASYYGWSKDNPRRFGREIGIVDLNCDGVVVYICPNCCKMVRKGPYWMSLEEEKRNYYQNGGSFHDKE